MSDIEDGFDSITSHQLRAKLVARADRDEATAAIRAGLSDFEAGRVEPARAALRALAKKYGVRMPGT